MFYREFVMAENHVISALIKKRSELSGKIEYYEKLLKELIYTL